MKDVEFWAEVKANLREAYASALHWQERARLPVTDGANFSDHRATGAMEGQACVHFLAG